jgi:hypothetical protein
MSVKEELHQTVDKLPDSEAPTALRFLQYLCDRRVDSVLRAFHDAPIDDEPVSAEDSAGSEKAWRSYLEGQDNGMPLEVVRRKLG